MREQAARFVDLDRVIGVSMGWGFGPWTRATGRLSEGVAERALQWLDACAARVPELADVVVLVGRPRASRSAA